MKQTKGREREDRYAEYKKISWSLSSAIQLIEVCHPGIIVTVLSKEVYRTEPTEHYPHGQAGVDIEILGHKTWMGIEAHCEGMIEWGPIIVDEYVYDIINKIQDKNKID